MSLLTHFLKILLTNNTHNNAKYVNMVYWSCVYKVLMMLLVWHQGLECINQSLKILSSSPKTAGSVLVVCIMITDDLVHMLKHQAISIHSAGKISIVLDQFQDKNFFSYMEQ